MLYYAVLECGALVSIYQEEEPETGDEFVGVHTESSGEVVGITGKIAHLCG